MRTRLQLSWHSLWNRRATTGLTLLLLTLSMALAVGMNRLRLATHQGFTQAVSGTDVIVGARSGAVPLLMATVFQIGMPTHNVSWQSFERWHEHPSVAWAVPLSMGDSHRGFRVLATNLDFYAHLRFGSGRPMTLEKGDLFDDASSVVLGSEVARQLGYDLGQELILSHGVGEAGFIQHGERRFRVVGVLRPTASPIDRTLQISLLAMAALHPQGGGDHHEGSHLEGDSKDHHGDRHDDYDEDHSEDALAPSLAAFFVGLKNKQEILHWQRSVNEDKNEPLQAVLPGRTLQDLWVTLGMIERTLVIMSSLVFIASLAAILLVLLTGLNERRREMAVLRAVGAGPGFVFSLLMFEVLVLVSVAGMAAWVSLRLLFWVASDWILRTWGLRLDLTSPSGAEWLHFAALLLVALIAGTIPAVGAYRRTLADGLSMRW